MCFLFFPFLFFKIGRISLNSVFFLSFVAQRQMENVCAKEKKKKRKKKRFDPVFRKAEVYERFSRHPRDVRGIMHWPFVPAILFHPLNPTSDRGWSLSTLFFFFPHRREKLHARREVFINQSITWLCLKASWEEKKKRRRRRKRKRKKRATPANRESVQRKEGRGEGGRKSSVDAENFMKAYSSCVDKIFAHNSPPMNEYITEKILIK